LSATVPSITITFSEAAESAVARSAQGVLCIVVKETTARVETFLRESDIVSSHYTAANLAAIKKAFVDTSPKKVIVVAKSTFPAYELDELSFSWICSAESAYQTNVATYVTTYNSAADRARRIKGVVMDSVSSTDDHIVRLAAQNLNGGSTVTTQTIIARVAAVLCVCPINESATFKPFAEIERAAAPSATGNYVYLLRDDDNIRLSRAVAASGDKVAVIEAEDIIREDIMLTFKNRYLGKMRNSPNNQACFCADILGYLKKLSDQGVVNGEQEISVDIDTDAMREAWASDASHAIDMSDWTDAQVRAKPYGSYLYIKAACSILDAIEDLTFAVALG